MSIRFRLGVRVRSDPEDRDVQVFVAKTGRRLLTSDEEEERAEVERQLGGTPRNELKLDWATAKAWLWDRLRGS